MWIVPMAANDLGLNRRWNRCNGWNDRLSWQDCGLGQYFITRDVVDLKPIGLAKRTLSEASTNGGLICRLFCNYLLHSLADGQGAEYRQTCSPKPECPHHPLPPRLVAAG